jgi:DNA modification methylase
MRNFQILQGSALERLSQLESGSVQCCVTSPPYWGLRDYGHDGQLGLERTPEEYVEKLVAIFREIKRVLRDDGTLWLNLGDTMWGGKGQNGRQDPSIVERIAEGRTLQRAQTRLNTSIAPHDGKHPVIKPKDLVGIPWMVAFALRADGWYLRQDIIWAKPNPMPESVEDRCTKSHEYIFLLTKSAKYFYDGEAIKEEAAYDGRKDTVMKGSQKYADGFVPNQSEQTFHARGHERWQRGEDGEYVRNKRSSVWTVNTKPFSEAHFAVFPPKLIEPCVLAGTSEKGCCARCGAPYRRVVERTAMVINRSTRGVQMGEFGKTAASGNVVAPASARTIGWQASCKCNSSIIPCTVLDPFTGSGTTGLVALRHNRNFIGVELNPEYIEMSRKRLSSDAPLFNQEKTA